MKATVLIVDDSKLARIVVAKALAALQPTWDRLEARDAQEALELIAKLPVDVVLVDYNMPGKNGLEFAKELRALRPVMPIAIITANVQDEIISRTRELNAAFIAKPLTDEALGAFLSGAALRLRKP